MLPPAAESGRKVRVLGMPIYGPAWGGVSRPTFSPREVRSSRRRLALRSGGGVSVGLLTLAHVEGQLDAVAEVLLVEDAADVPLHRPQAEAELRGDTCARGRSGCAARGRGCLRRPPPVSAIARGWSLCASSGSPSVTRPFHRRPGTAQRCGRADGQPRATASLERRQAGFPCETRGAVKRWGDGLRAKISRAVAFRPTRPA